MKLYKWYKCINRHGWSCFSDKNAENVSDIRINYEDSFFVLEKRIPKWDIPGMDYMKILLNNQILYISFNPNIQSHIDYMVEL